MRYLGDESRVQSSSQIVVDRSPVPLLHDVIFVGGRYAYPADL